MNLIADKWDAIYSDKQCSPDTAAYVLQEHKHLLPNFGKALDLACGLGGNSILLAENGFTVDAWDVSTQAINKINVYAGVNGLNICASKRNVETNPPEPNTYDVVTVSYFLHRPILNKIVASVKMGGLLFYQTFTAEKIQQGGPSNPDYLLNKNELLETCKGMDILFYREEGLQGDTNKGYRDQAMIITKRTK